MSNPWSSVDDSPATGLPAPRPTDVTRPHWDGCARGELLVQQCDACSAYVFTPLPACDRCFSSSLRWVKSSGRGTIYSYTLIHRPQRPEFETPYCVAIIQLDEGWRMLSNIVDCDLERIAIGDAVEVCFAPRGEIVMPMFRPAR